METTVIVLVSFLPNSDRNSTQKVNLLDFIPSGSHFAANIVYSTLTMGKLGETDQIEAISFHEELTVPDDRYVCLKPCTRSNFYFVSKMSGVMRIESLKNLS